MRKLGLMLLACWSWSALADTAVMGDRENGAALFRVQCAACHGADGHGAGPIAGSLSIPVPSLRDPAFLATRSDEGLRSAILKGVQRKGASVAVMPPAPWLTSLELADLIAFMRHGQLRVTDFFPQARFLVAKTYPFDKSAQDRLQKLVGHALGAGESRIKVITLYGDGHPGGPDVVPDDPVQLDKLDPKDGKGYLVFADLLQGRSRVTYGIALDREGAVKAAASVGGLENVALDRAYQAFVGLGDKKTSALLKPKAKGKAGPSAAESKAFNDAYERALVGVGLADREEKDRHWADTK
jgi:Cytochrome C oxidase, cbb3-type, subunit III